MKKSLKQQLAPAGLTIIILYAACTISLPAVAQLAAWKPAGNTSFPEFNSNQVNGYCRIPQFIFDPVNASTMWAVSAEGGLFKSVDEGLHWNVLPGMEHNTNYCASICVDRSNPSVILLGTGDPDYYHNGTGVWKSIDGGQQFSPSGLDGLLVLQILQDPSNAARFVAATSLGIFVSINGGTSWTATLETQIVGGVPVNVPLTGQMADMKKNAAAGSRVLYACTKDLNPVFYRSTDFGDHWQKITNGLNSYPISYPLSGGRIAVTAANTNRVYFFLNGGLGMVYKSDDGGLSFQLQKPEGASNLTGYNFGNNTINNGQGNYNSALCADNANPDRIWYSAHTFSTSADAGQHFNLLHEWYSGIHTDAKMIMQSPGNPAKLWASNDGGIWLSTDNGQSWIPRSDGLFAYEVTPNAGKGSRTRGDIIQIGTQDNGTVTLQSGTWTTYFGGDDYAAREYDYLPDGGYIYYPGEEMYRYNAVGKYGALFGLPLTAYSNIVFNRKDKNLSFACDNLPSSKLYRTTNLAAQTPDWTPLFTVTGRILAMASAAANPDRFYAVTNSGRFYYATNAKAAVPSFSFFTLPVASVSRASIAVIANNADKIYVALDSKVYYSQNGGASWQNITYNLPNVTHRKILCEEYGGSQELVFIATNNAVYYKKAGQVNWTLYATGLPSRRPPTDFSLFDDSTAHARLRYASYGRAVFETPFANLRPLEAIIDMPDTISISCTAGAVTMKEASNGVLNEPVSFQWSFPGGSPQVSNLRTPEITYADTGTYSITLTITDALNNRSTTTVSRYIQRMPCRADTIPGRALQTASGNNFATTGPVNLGTTQAITVSAWVKTSTVHSIYTGIVVANDMPSTGLILLDDNQLGFMWNDNYWNLTGGPTLPADGAWHQVALVIAPTRATIYLDGNPHVFDGLQIDPLQLVKSWNIGNSLNFDGWTFEGQVDELCFYNRALSTAEIRENMNLTRNNSATDPSLRAYYQFNEKGALLFDRASPATGSLAGTAALVKSTAPVGGGRAQTLSVNAAGPAEFTAAGLTLLFPPGGTYPNGPVVATRLHIAPDKTVSTFGLPYPGRNYWIVRSYGNNTIYTPPAAITFSDVKGTTADLVSNPAIVKLHTRPANAEGNTWGNAVAAGAVATNTNGTGSITFDAGLGSAAFSQLLLESPSLFRVVSFTGVKENNSSALLQWEVRGEAGIVSYEVQRSINGGSFSAIGIVQVAGLGNYQFRDLHPALGTDTYRLLIKDITGATSYSNEVVLEFIRPALQVVLSPVPATQTLELRMNQPLAAPLSLQLFNSAGQLVAKETIPAGAVSHMLTLTRYSAGLYTIALRKESGKLLFKEQFSKVNR